MITITLEGDSWQEIADQMCDYLMRGAKTYESVDEMFADMDQNTARAPRTEAKPDKGIVAQDERECQDGPKKPVCAYCGASLGPGATVDSLGRAFCSAACADMSRHDPYRLGLGPEERAEILERVRQ